MRIPDIAVLLPGVISATYSIYTVDYADAARALAAETAASASALATPTQHKILVSSMRGDASSSSGLKAASCRVHDDSCGSAGCFDQTTHKCCPGDTNICEASHTCVQVPTANGTIAHGCCPFGTACGDQCIDTSSSKCCAVPGGGFGSCPAGSDCCGNMCCDGGLVCARSSDGPQCWPKGGHEGSKIAGGASPTIKGDWSGAEMARVVQTGSATFIPGLGDPERSGSVRLRVSLWPYVLLLLTPIATAISATILVEPEIKVAAYSNVVSVAINATSEPTTTLITAISLQTNQREVHHDLSEKKGGVAHGGGGHRGSAKPGAGNGGGAKNGTESRTISLDTMWLLMLLALPQLLGPLALADFVGSVTPSAPATDTLEYNNDLSVMSTGAAASPVPDLTIGVALSEKKKFKFGGGGGSLAVESRPNAMTMLMLCVLPLFASLALAGVIGLS